MTRIIATLAAGLLLSLGTSIALAEEGDEGHVSPSQMPAEEMGHGSMGQAGMGMDKPGMMQGETMHDMHTRMQALHDHSKMMEGMTDQKQLVEEMKKHMRMIDEMMEKMMQRHTESTSGGEPKP